MEPNDLQGFYGVVGFEEPETDYRLAGFLDLPTPRHTFAEKHIQYNQNAVQANSCTLHGTAGAISDLTGYPFSQDELTGVYKQAKLQPRPFQDNFGWWTNDAVDLWRNTWNATHNDPYDKLLSFAVLINSDEFWKMIHQGYSVVCSISANLEFVQDMLDNGRIDITKLTGPVTYGHCWRMAQDPLNADAVLLFVDNYLGRQFNTISIDKEHITALMKDWVISARGYVYVFEYDFNNLNNPSPIPPWANAAFEKATKKGVTISPTDVNLPVTEKSLENLFTQLKLFTAAPTGHVSMARLLVALDRAKVFDSIA